MTWFSKMYECKKAIGRMELLDITKDKIRFDNYYEGCKDPDTDNARLEAVKAIEAYHNAIERYTKKIGKELDDALEYSDGIINWNNLFKKRRHP